MQKKKLLINTLSEVVPYLIIACLGLVKGKVFLDLFGKPLNGNYIYIMHLLSFIFVGEAGLTGAIMFHLYKPFAINDCDSINNLYTASIKIFRWVGLITMGLVTLISLILFCFPSVASIVPGKEIEVIGAFLIISIAYSIPSFIRSHTYSALFAAFQNQYVCSWIFGIFRIIIDLIIISTIHILPSLLYVSFIILIAKILEEVTVNYFGHRMFNWVKKTKTPDMTPISTTIDLIRHHLGSMLVNNTDLFVIAAFVDASAVTLFGTYFIIPTFLAAITGKLNIAIGHMLGQMFATETNKKMLQAILDYIIGMVIVAFGVAMTYVIGGRSFVMIFYNEPGLMVSYYLLVHSPLIYLSSFLMHHWST